jgi:hypothetical protein
LLYSSVLVSLTDNHRYEKSRLTNTAPVEKNYLIKSIYSSTAATQIVDFRPSNEQTIAYRMNEMPSPIWEVPHLTKTPWELERSRKSAVWKRSKTAPECSTHLFQTFPSELYECIITQLEQLHARRHPACPSCYLGDLHKLSLVNHEFKKAASQQMCVKVLLYCLTPCVITRSSLRV